MTHTRYIAGALLRYFILSLLLLVSHPASAQTLHTVDDLPNPQINNHTNVCDPDMLLSGDAIDSLNMLAAGMKKSTGVELAIAVVSDFDQNQDEFNFATALFRKWGVGGKNSSNGLLLFVAVNRKQYRFVTGYGLEGTLPDVSLSAVGREYLVPAFKQGNYGAGIVKAIQVIDAYLRQPVNQKDLEALMAKDRVKPINPWYQQVGLMALLIFIYVLLTSHLKKQTPPYPKKSAITKSGYDNVISAIVVGLFVACFAAVFVFAFTIGFSWMKGITLTTCIYILYVLLALAFTLKYLNALSVIRKSHTDDINYNQAAYQFQKHVWWYVLFSPLVILFVIIEAMKRKRDRGRVVAQTDKDGKAMTRVDRDQNPTGKPYLTDGQQCEEKDGVYSYDIWVGSTATNFKVIANEGSNFSQFDECPQCHFKTLAKPIVKTLRAATYTTEGQGQKAAVCSFCKYTLTLEFVTLPKRTRSDSSSSSSSGSSSSSSSSDSGSFGGGSTGGGGAGGSW